MGVSFRWECLFDGRVFSAPDSSAFFHKVDVQSPLGVCDFGRALGMPKRGMIGQSRIVFLLEKESGCPAVIPTSLAPKVNGLPFLWKPEFSSVLDFH